MTNEELVMAIQNNYNENLIEQLWLQVEKFIKAYAKKFYYGHQLRCDQMCVDAEDLSQTGYFALINAVENFKADAGSSFINYLTYHLKAQFYKACKMNSSTWQKNTVYQAGELTDILENTLSDEIDIAEHVVEQAYIEQASKDITKAVDSLTQSQREIITLIYFEGLTYQACADKLGITKGGACRSAQRAFVHLRNDLSAYKKEVA